jgi:hypothetical protein
MNVGKISMNDDDKLWPEEEEALDDIMSGKTKMITQSGEDVLKELDSIIKENECCPPPQEESTEWCTECLRIQAMGGEYTPTKAVKGYTLCTDCYKILTEP